jgi:hypothetical protein
METHAEIHLDKDEMNFVKEELEQSRILSAKIADLMFTDDTSVGQRLMACSILLGSMAALHDVPLVAVMGLVKNWHDRSAEFFHPTGIVQ